MVAKHLRTSDIAKELGVHVNSVRLYEASGFLPEIPRPITLHHHTSLLK